MAINVESAIEALKEISSEADAKFGAMSAEQVNWRPQDGGWSIGQCIEHLIRSNELFFDEFDKVASGTRKNSVWQSWSPFTAVSGRFLIKSLRADEKKVKTIKTMVPPSEIAGDVVQRFAEHNERLAGKIRSVANADLARTVVSSPFLSLVTYNLGDGLEIILEHERRHLRQAERVALNEGFPR